MAKRYPSNVMQHLKARVHNGRLLLDEPTDLPEGEVVELVPVDEILLGDDRDELDDEERARLHESLEKSSEEMKAGKTLDWKVAMGELRARR